jgi:hypothetical protein
VFSTVRADNFWLLYELHPLAYFIEMLPLLHLEVQQLVLKVRKGEQLCPVIIFGLFSRCCAGAVVDASFP